MGMDMDMAEAGGVAEVGGGESCQLSAVSCQLSAIS
jgi:hypothetical protein